MTNIFYIYADDEDKYVDLSLHENTDEFDCVIEPCKPEIGDLFYLHTPKHIKGENWGYLGNVLFTISWLEPHLDRSVCKIEAIL